MTLALALLLGCNNSDKGEETAPDLGDDSGGDCSGTAPEITDFTTEDGDVLTNEDGEQQPSIKFTVDYTDVDLDLNEVTIDVWFDAEVDGSVDTARAADMSTGRYHSEDGECTVGSGQFKFQVGIVGDPLDFETTYDFAAVVLDMNDIESAPAFTTGTTPAAL